MIARYTGPAGNGVFSLFITNVSFFILFFGFSIDSTIVYFGSKGKINLSWIVSMLLPLLVIQCSLFAATLFIAHFFFHSTLFQTGVTTDGAFWAFAFIFSNILYNYFSAFLLSKKVFFKISLYNVIAQALLLGWMLLEKQTGGSAVFVIEDLIPVYTCLYIVNGVVVIILAFKTNTEKVEFKNPFKIFDKQMLQYTGLVFAGNTLQFFAYRVDIWLMEYYHSRYALGIYALSSKIAQLWWLIPQLVATLLFPLTALGHQSVSEKKFFRIIAMAVACSLVTAIAAIFIFPFFIDIAVGALYRDSYFPFLFLMPGIVMWSVNILIAARLAGEGNVSINLQGSALCFILILVLDFWLIPSKAAVGAAVASSIAYSCSTIFVIVKYLKWRKK